MSLKPIHEHLTNGEGKCSVPMWMGGLPAGFCDEPAYGERIPGDTYRVAETGEIRRMDGVYSGYVPGLACPIHGGPNEKISPQNAHFGDPCKYCNTPHDDVRVGPCVERLRAKPGPGYRDH